MWFPNRSDTNRTVQAQKRARSLKFRIYVEEELYYPSSENKGADQLCSYCEADLCLCFRPCRLSVFPRGGSNMSRLMRKPTICMCENKDADQLISVVVFATQIVHFLFFLNLKFCRFVSDLFGNHIVGFLTRQPIQLWH